MDKKTFDKITKEVFLGYGFYKKGNRFLLQLEDVCICVRFASGRGVKYFSYNFSINALYDDAVPPEKRYDSVLEMKLEHSPLIDGYQSHEILYEEYTETEYRELLVRTLHSHFDEYKKNALQFLRENSWYMYLRQEAIKYLGLE